MSGGGAERQLAQLAEGLTALGCETHAAFIAKGPWLQRLAASGATIHNLRAAGNYDPLLPPRVLSLMRRVRPDVVQTWLTQMDIVGGAAALMLRRPWILSERASALGYDGGVKDQLRRFLGRRAAAVVANSPQGGEYWSFSPARKYVIPNALDSEEIAAAPRDADPSLDGAQVILFAGRLAPQKNLPVLLDALTEVVARRNAIALLCGIGPEEDQIRERIRGQERIRLLGFTDRVIGLMKRADVCVSTSIYEGAPNVLLEAAACGSPLVVSDIAEHRALLGEGSALFAPAGDAAAFAQKILQTLDDPAAARQRAEAAMRDVDGLSIARVAREYARLYEEIVALN